MRLKVFVVVCIFVGITFLACSNEEVYDDIQGVWVSAQLRDTLDFVNAKDLYRSNSFMEYDHYDYELFADSIKIGYRGKLYVGTVPTTHKYSIHGTDLTIDFSNEKCYGFDLKEITYEKR